MVKNIFNLENLKKKTDWFLTLLILGGIFLFDVAMNKASDLGASYEVTLWVGTTILATSVMWIGGLIIFVSLGTLIANDMMNKKGLILADYIAGMVGFFAFSIVILGGVLQIFHVETLPFFFWEIFTINLYHWIALAGMFGTIIYFMLVE